MRCSEIKQLIFEDFRDDQSPIQPFNSQPNMNFADDDEELRFLSIFVNQKELSVLDLATKQLEEQEQKQTKQRLNATQTMQKTHRKDLQKTHGEKQRMAQREVTTQGCASALHLHRNQDAVNRAAQDLVDGRSTGGVGVVPTSLENAYQRAKAMYSGGQIKQALAIWLQGIKMLRGSAKPPSAALAAYLGAASQAERSLGFTRKALNHATDALKYARLGGETTSTLVTRLEQTVHLIRTDLGETDDMNTNGYNFGLGIATEEYLEMDPEALETVQEAITDAVNGDASTLKQLLEMAEMLGNNDYSRGIARASTNGTNITALMVASAYGQINVVKQLARMGGDVKAKDSSGFTCLVWACRANQVETATVLLNDFNAPWVAPSVKASDEIKHLLNSVPKNNRRATNSGKGNKSKSGKKNGKKNNNQKKSGGSGGAGGAGAGGAGAGRTLQAWKPSANESQLKADGIKQSDKIDKKYNQFTANQKLGVKKVEYNEEEYTSKLKNSSKSQLGKANKLAKEIEQKNSRKNKKSNAMDPEDKHSAVIQSKKNGNDGFTDSEVNKKKKKGVPKQ